MLGFVPVMTWIRIGLPLASMFAVHGGLAAQPPRWVERIAFWAAAEVDGLRHEIQTIDRQLARLPTVAGINSGNRNGYQSAGIPPGGDPWIEIELASPTKLEWVVLVPLLAKGVEYQVPGFGFPRRFILEGFTEDGDEPVVLRDQTARVLPNPACYPVSAAVPPELALRRIRLTATELWRSDGPPVFALSEVMLLQGNRNLTRGARVLTSSSREIPPSWSRNNLLDMMTPLGLPIAPAEAPVMGWHGEVRASQGGTQHVTVDLGEPREIDEVRLAPAWTARLPWDSHYGFPARFLLEGSATGEEDSWFVIYDRTATTLQSPGRNLQIFNEIPGPARFLRMTATRLRERTGDFVFALGELQAYQGDQNIALGASVAAPESLVDDEWRPKGLTDGRAAGGNLLELPDWIQRLEQRRTLEVRREVLARQLLSTLVRAEHDLIAGSVGGALAIVMVAGTFSWRGHRLRVLERERFRERLARDLHDELGSNLGSIALISSLAGQEDAVQMRIDLAEIERVARESADSMRDMVSLLGGKRGGPGGDWLQVLKDLAERLLRGLESECALPAAPLVWEPNLETRRELYLFCKEVLHNAVRHGRPSRVRFALHPTTAGGLRVEIEDDGQGFDPNEAPEGHGLANLRERAATLRADMQLDSSPGRGTTVTLDIPRGRRWKKR
jgi:signal transduction histidine kinase